MSEDKWKNWVDRVSRKAEKRRLAEQSVEQVVGKRFQFSLKTMLLVPVVSALLCLAYNWFRVPGLIAASLGLAILLSYLPQFQVPVHWRPLREMVCIVAFLGMLGVLCEGMVNYWQEDARRTQCRDNLKQIGIALQNYRADHGCFPSAYIADETGKPIHSWRVLLLPYLEQKPLYDQYDFSEPWDGPTNSRLNRYAVEIYLCPSEPWNKPGWETNYMAVVGAGTRWPGREPFSTADTAHSFGDSILLVEVANSGISWMEPKDLNFDQMDFAINDWSRPGIRSHHRGGANVLLADGPVRFLTRRDQGDLKKLLMIDLGRGSKP